MKFIPFGRALELAAIAAIIIGLVLIVLGLLSYAAKAEEVPPEPNAVVVDGRPLTAVVITSCNQIVAVYMTMPDGRMVRFDIRNQKEVPADALLAAAYTAKVSERIEMGCGNKPMRIERHEKPV